MSDRVFPAVPPPACPTWLLLFPATGVAGTQGPPGAPPAHRGSEPPRLLRGSEAADAFRRPRVLSPGIPRASAGEIGGGWPTGSCSLGSGSVFRSSHPGQGRWWKWGSLGGPPSSLRSVCSPLPPIFGVAALCRLDKGPQLLDLILFLTFPLRSVQCTHCCLPPLSWSH